MDYCYACRRHLNGAYSCPGCGTPADRLALPAVGETAQLPAVGADGDGPADDAAHGGGRAARRLAARGQAAHQARRGRQRATVYGIGVIAAVGAAAMLSVAALSGGSSGDGTPPTPLDHNPPAPTSGDTSPDGSGAGPDHAAPSGGPQTSSSGTPTTSPTASGSASPTATPGGGTPSTPASPVTGSISPKPPSRSPSTAPTTPPPPSSSPSPTQTPCKQVLWWCG
ncbi:hypothetical protein AB0399_13520 [Streptomyces sp. NPDC088194]|uniref:SCO2400 family protein n=1 Tax=Streptomyces sp. NPDC088194 TaxID=3154931 RepID=UPI00344B0C43